MDTTRASLILRVRDSTDRTAWDEFDGIYRPILKRFAGARGLAEDEAEEVAQQCMTALCEHIREFDYDPAKGKFKAWLRTMVNNRILNSFRGRREQPARTQDLERLAENDRTPDELFDMVWRREHLRHCLTLIRAEVEPTTFDAFVEHVIDERPVEQVCQSRGMTANQVHAIKSRMLKRIRERMIELLGEEPEG